MAACSRWRSRPVNWSGTPRILVRRRTGVQSRAVGGGDGDPWRVFPAASTAISVPMPRQVARSSGTSTPRAPTKPSTGRRPWAARSTDRVRSSSVGCSTSIQDTRSLVVRLATSFSPFLSAANRPLATVGGGVCVAVICVCRWSQLGQNRHFGDVTRILSRERQNRRTTILSFSAKSDATPIYSTTSSATARIFAGKSRPSAFAVLRLITSSSFVTRTTGRSAGFSPFRTRPA